jgi:hypothetical protein
MRIKLSIVAGVVSLTVAGIAAAAQGTSIFTSSANPLSTIGELVATSLWDANNSDAKPITITPTTHHVAIVTFGNLQASKIPSLPNNQSTYIPSVNLQAYEFSTINSNDTVGDSGSSENNNITGGNSNNFSAGVGGGGVNWGSAPVTKLYYYPGSSIGGTGSDLSGVAVTSSTNIALVPSTPEPGEWLQMILGFGLVGIFAIHRKHNHFRTDHNILTN